MKVEYKSDIFAIMDAENCIRASRKYTKKLYKRTHKHPIQGENIASIVFTEYYDVYPSMECIGWNMKASDAFTWLLNKNIPHIDIRFRYNYRDNKGIMTIRGSTNGVMEDLIKGIPGFNETLHSIDGNGYEH